mmetsp:Transcript_20465/g.15090  ORF Transcript_20465/g.15090 Transcript_20465/m.15090 type:complete len:470 (+) Transcript_20465:55-1464(+)
MSAFETSVMQTLQAIQARLSAIEAKMGIQASGAGSGDAPAAALHPGLLAFDEYANQYLPPFVAATSKLGDDVKLAGKIIEECFGELRSVLELAANCKEPPQSQMREVLTPLGTKMQSLSPLLKRNDWERHMKTLTEGIGALNWVAIKPNPREFIESFIGGSDYWANNIRKEFRTTNPDQIAFCDTFKALLVNLMAFVKANYAPGLNWTPRGVTIQEFKNSPKAPASSASTQSAAPTAAAAPVASAAPASTNADAAKADLFSALNKDGAVTAGLKKVTKDMQTWRAEYKGGDAPAPDAKKPAPSRAVNNEVKGPAKLEFVPAASKWVVENQNSSVDVPINDKKETVYIFGCNGATINITGKCKSVVVDSSKRTTVYVDNAMASVEVVNCQRMNIHVRDTVASVAIDKTDGIVVHLPKSSLHTDIVASKSSEMNVSFPDANDDIIERPIPEQYVHRVKGTSITAEVSDLYH